MVDGVFELEFKEFIKQRHLSLNAEILKRIDSAYGLCVEVGFDTEFVQSLRQQVMAGGTLTAPQKEALGNVIRGASAKLDYQMGNMMTMRISFIVIMIGGEIKL